MESKRMPKRAVDDSQVAGRSLAAQSQGESFEAELKRKAMTLGRPAVKKKLHVRHEATKDQHDLPPPLPARLQSKKGMQTKNEAVCEGTSQEDSPNPPPRSQSMRQPVLNDSNGVLPPRIKALSGNRRNVPPLKTVNTSNSFKSQSSYSEEFTTLKQENEQTVRQPPKRKESMKGIAPQIASRRALLQASFAPTDQHENKAEFMSVEESTKQVNEQAAAVWQPPKRKESMKGIAPQIASRRALLQASFAPTDQQENKAEFKSVEESTNQENEQAVRQTPKTKESMKGIAPQIVSRQALLQASFVPTDQQDNKAESKSVEESTKKENEQAAAVRQPPKRRESMNGIAPQIASRRALLQASFAPTDQQKNKAPMELIGNRGTTESEPPILRKPIKTKLREIQGREALENKSDSSSNVNRTVIELRQTTTVEQSSSDTLLPSTNTSHWCSDDRKDLSTQPIAKSVQYHRHDKTPMTSRLTPTASKWQSLTASCLDTDISTNFNQTSEPQTCGVVNNGQAQPSSNQVVPIKETTSLESLDENYETEQYESIDNISTPHTTTEREGNQQSTTHRRNSDEVCNSQVSNHGEGSQLQEPTYQDEKLAVGGGLEDQNGDLQELAGPIDILTMISKYTHFLPMCVRVCHGFCSSICESFSKFDQLRLHFVKHCKVVVLMDEESQDAYTIPVSSALSFGLVYESEGFDVTQQLRTVGDIMEMKPLPRAVLATKQFKSGTPEKSVEANELLFVNKISKSLLLGKGRVLEVFTTDYKVKRLGSKCAGEFSVHPMDVQMTLSTIIEHSIQLPQRVIMFSDSTIRSYLPETMKDQPVLLESIRGETSVICTMKDSHCEQGEQQVMDVSADLNIKVEIEPITESEEKELYDTTTLLYHTLNPAQLEFITEKTTRRSYDLQCLLYKKLIPGKEMDGVHFQLPNSCSLDVQPQIDQSHEAGHQIDPLSDTQSLLSTEDSFIASDLHSVHQQHSGSTDLSTNEDEGLYEDVDTACTSLPTKEASRLRKIMKTNTTTTQSKLFQKLKSAVSKKTKVEDKNFETKDYNYREHHFDPIIQQQPPQRLPREKEDDEEFEIPDYDYMPHVSGTPSEELPHHDRECVHSVEPEECYEPVPTTGMENEEGDYSDVRMVGKPTLQATERGTDLSTDTDCSTVRPSQYAQLNSKVNTLVAELNALKLQVQKLATTVESFMGKTVKATHVQQSERQNNSKLKLQAVTTVKRPLPQATCSKTNTTQLQSNSGQNEEIDRNKAFLATLTCDQVGQLLTNMHLSEYKSEFLRQCIDGRRLLEIDDKTLEETFQVKTNFHRRKMMRVILGGIYSGPYISQDS